MAEITRDDFKFAHLSGRRRTLCEALDMIAGEIIASTMEEFQRRQALVHLYRVRGSVLAGT